MGSLALFGLTLAAACGGGGGYGSTPTTMPPAGGSGGADVTITINGEAGNMSFSPNPATVKVGQRVSWRNADSITHAILQDAPNAGQTGPYGGGGGGSGFSTGNLGAAATSAPLTMSAAGTTGYHCEIHPGMVGVLTVTQ